MMVAIPVKRKYKQRKAVKSFQRFVAADFKHVTLIVGHNWNKPLIFYNLESNYKEIEIWILYFHIFLISSIGKFACNVKQKYKNSTNIIQPYN